MVLDYAHFYFIFVLSFESIGSNSFFALRQLLPCLAPSQLQPVLTDGLATILTIWLAQVRTSSQNQFVFKIFSGPRLVVHSCLTCLSFTLTLSKGLPGADSAEIRHLFDNGLPSTTPSPSPVRSPAPGYSTIAPGRLTTAVQRLEKNVSAPQNGATFGVFALRGSAVDPVPQSTKKSSISYSGNNDSQFASNNINSASGTGAVSATCPMLPPWAVLGSAAVGAALRDVPPTKSIWMLSCDAPVHGRSHVVLRCALPTVAAVPQHSGASSTGRDARGSSDDTSEATAETPDTAATEERREPATPAAVEAAAGASSAKEVCAALAEEATASASAPASIPPHERATVTAASIQTGGGVWQRRWDALFEAEYAHAQQRKRSDYAAAVADGGAALCARLGLSAGVGSGLGLAGTPLAGVTGGQSLSAAQRARSASVPVHPRYSESAGVNLSAPLDRVDEVVTLEAAARGTVLTGFLPPSLMGNAWRRTDTTANTTNIHVQSTDRQTASWTDATPAHSTGVGANAGASASASGAISNTASAVSLERECGERALWLEGLARATALKAVI